MALLKLENLEAGYGAIRALRGVSLNVEAGSIVALLGANGAGKSTALKSISGMIKPRAGYVEYDGQKITGRTPNQIVGLGIAQVPEGRKIFRDLTVIENLKMGAYSRKDTAGITQDLDMSFELFPILKERAKQLGGSLSGGEQQMLAIGRGLMARPQLLLLDEPSLGLAPLLVQQIFETLTRINRETGTTLLVVEQNAHIALKNSHYGYVLRVGKVAVEGKSEELQKNKEVVESYMGTQQ